MTTMIADAEFAALVRGQTALSGRYVCLDRLSYTYETELFEASRPAEIWTYLRSAQPQTLADFQRGFIQPAIDAAAHGTEVPFAVIDLASGRAIGCTSYVRISAEHRHLEIGGTWYAPAFWRTAVNTESKYLLLSNAFEHLGCIRVQLRTDERNLRSRAAIERIGGKLEGIIRQDRIVTKDGGRIRSSAQYSLTADEWPANKARLEAMLAR
ncbi:MAG TPA: GNAT family protein [Dehalococcoidia bacterium]|nr:GNAT family protein [Dehalococcoidia bacterium]